MAEPWVVAFLNDVVVGELDAQPDDIRAHFLRISELIASYGLEKMREPYVKRIQGKLWEMRLKGKDGIARALYVTVKGRRVVVLRVFTKKTEKTPNDEIKLALTRAKEIA
jgi:phage-related protein